MKQTFKVGDKVKVDGDLATGTGKVVGVVQVVRVKVDDTWGGGERVIRYDEKDVADGKLTRIRPAKRKVAKAAKKTAKKVAKKKDKTAKARKR